MSKLLVSQYHAELDRIVQYGGSRNETTIRGAFERLLREYCRPRDFELIPELEYKKTTKGRIVPDGTVKDALKLDWGYWESKDQYDNLDEEIEKKFEKGYPNDNILFEDSQTAVLFHSGCEIARVSMRDAEALDRTLNAFVNYMRPEVKDFREAIKIFKQDLPTILETLRGMLQTQERSNPQFCQRRNRFLEICRESINPEMSLFDVQEMLIQHILTEDIFLNIFNESQFHRENNIARELHQIVDTFFTGATRKNTLSTIERYYAVIRRTAANIYNHHEKQKFLKAVYENFYKIYDPKAADRLGVVYTPNEIVRFMIESADHLTFKHFGKVLADPGVEILDPATGTATFITELIEYLPKNKLEQKYKNEIHCNEVAILPYYIANLNIEYTYKQKMDKYEEFSNICLVDTLEHTGFEGKQGNLLALSIENTERIKRQNDRQVTLIIGNPPYNAKQENYNDRNANRAYAEVDKRIRETYVKQGTAQNQIVLYDMYVRFLRWASDRLDANGVVSLVVNSSFIDAKTFDGFRKTVTKEFSNIYIIDLGGKIRQGDKTGNVFGIRTGIAVIFMIKKQDKATLPCRILYTKIEQKTAEEKLAFLRTVSFNDLLFESIYPDNKSNWINQSNNDFNSLVPLVDKDVKAGKSETAIFQLFSSGVKTQRDEWVYDFSKEHLSDRMKYFVDVYEYQRKTSEKSALDVKWDEDLTRYLESGVVKQFENSSIQLSLYRPFTKKYFYFDKHFNGRTYQMFNVFPKAEYHNKVIGFMGQSEDKPFTVISADSVVDLNAVSPASGGTQCLPLYRYDKNGNRIDNITDWGLTQFQNHYNDSTITKENIFHYTYAVLHHPVYRTQYELNLKREFPRLPFYENFHQWAAWGKQLMELHIHYESVEPFGLKRWESDSKREKTPKAKLKIDRDNGIIILDDHTHLKGVPSIAWSYKLGNRSALEWILDQYKEKTPKDPTIREKFNTYRFADYKECVIELLDRVCTVSVETMRIIQQMPSN